MERIARTGLLTLAAFAVACSGGAGQPDAGRDLPGDPGVDGAGDLPDPDATDPGDPGDGGSGDGTADGACGNASARGRCQGRDVRSGRIRRRSGRQHQAWGIHAQAPWTFRVRTCLDTHKG